MVTEQSHADKCRAGELKWRGMPPGIPPEMAVDFMAKLRGGSTIRKLTSGTSGPSLVSYERFKKHCDLHPDWAREARAISDENGRSLKGARHRDMTHCGYGHPFSGANLHYIPSGRRICQACQRRRNASPLPPSQEQIRQATAALNAGKSLSLVCTGKIGAERVQPRILTFRKLKLYRALNPAFDKFVVSATAHNNSKGQQRRHHPERARIEIVRSQSADFQQIVDLVPIYLPPDVRHDIAQSIFVALFEGSLQRDQVRARVQRFVIEHNRMFPTKYAKFGDSPLVSLDEVMFEDGSTTRGDNVSRGLWD